MPRRRDYLSDGSDSDASASQGSEDGANSQEDEDSKAERRLFEYNGRKRRKTGGGKEAAWEGIFGEEPEGARSGGRGLGSKRGGKRGGFMGAKTDWTKAPSFVPTASRPDEDPAKNGTDGGASVDGSDGSGESGESDEESDADVPTRPASPRIRDVEPDEDEDDQPRRGMGLGFRAASSAGSKPDLSSASRNEDVKPKLSGRAGIGMASRTARADAMNFASKSETAEEPSRGLGSGRASLNGTSDATAADRTPSVFGRSSPSVDPEASSSRPQSAFRGRQQETKASATPTDLSANERAHFRSIQSSFGARMLANLGWEAGKGLGIQEDGRAVPIEAGKHMRGQGISSGIRTEDSKRDARRRGEKISDDEEDVPVRRRGKARQPGSGAKQPDQEWKSQKKVKVKVEHKTYEQLLAEAGGAGSAAGVGQIIDARGGELKEVQSMSALSLSTWTPTSDSMQLPELRHNLRLILDVGRGDVIALAQEGKMVYERRTWSLREEARARRHLEEVEKELNRLQSISAVVEAIMQQAAIQAKASNPSLSPLSADFDRLVGEFKSEYEELALDEVVVGAIAQVLQRAFSEWRPFDVSSDFLLSSLKPWRKAFRLPRGDAEDAQALTLSDTGHRASMGDEGERDMTAWETFLWTNWLPKVRSAINNDWNPYKPHAAVHLLESWEPLLPPFIRDNIIDQLVLPKVKAAADEWDPRRSKAVKGPKSLAGIIFPWLPLLGARVEDVMDGAKRRLRTALRKWVVKDGVADELSRWKKDVYSSSEWDKLMLQNVVPKLGVCLREDFQINPRSQDMVPLIDWIMPWHLLVRPSIFAHLLEVEFFPKWLNVLYLWLTHPTYKPDEVATWYDWWKKQFPQAVLDMRGVAHGFDAGVKLMMDAVNLGADAPKRLRKPDFQPLPPSKSSAKPVATPVKRPQSGALAHDADITFRSLAEDYAVQKDLIFLPLGQSHRETGKPLFKVSKSVDGRGGITVYVGDSAVFAQMEDGSFRAISLEDMVKRALA